MTMLANRTATEWPAVLCQPGLSRDTVHALADALDEPGWARDLRAAGWDAWETIPKPTPTTEGWRRTDLRGVYQGLPTVRAAAPPRPEVARLRELPPALRRQLDPRPDEGGLLIQHDGSPVYNTLADELRPQGVLLLSMEQALREHEELVRPYFMHLVPPDWQSGMPANDGKFQTLHSALWRGGSFVYVPPGVEVTAPLRSFMWPEAAGFGWFPHTVILLGDHSKLVYTEEYRSADPPSGAPALFGSAVTEIYLGRGARLDYLSLQHWSQSAQTMFAQRATLGRDAYINWVVVALGGALTRGTVDALLEGPGSEALMMGMAFGEGRQTFDFHTLQDHLASWTVSDQLYKTAMRDYARLVYEGLIRIRPGSQNTNGYQQNRNLLLSRTAKADSIPMLEIQNNEVRCTHGAASGPVDREQLHYLRSRGLAEDEAERVIIHGFFEPVIHRVAAEAVREKLRTAIDRKLSGLRQVATAAA